MRKTTPEAKKARQHAYYLAHKKIIMERAKGWKKANREKVLEGCARYRVKAADKIAAYNEGYRARESENKKLYHLKNKDKFCAKARKHYAENTEAHKSRMKEYRIANRDEIRNKDREYRKHRMATDVVYKLTQSLRRRIAYALKGEQKRGRTMQLIGCDGDTLRNHIESQFVDGMTWENRSTWHIDHILPVAEFDLINSEEQEIAFHYTNLQPLWAKDNRVKSASLRLVGGA